MASWLKRALRVWRRKRRVAALRRHHNEMLATWRHQQLPTQYDDKGRPKCINPMPISLGETVHDFAKRFSPLR